ncbi:homeobox protein knotted-1-like 1 [Juglans microcarpa x Juglans regia]|uniref:homeobox protein knotted-1-like 1 n=1 Tax=Juglans microcarpa x Juglans regia TaxID=2249226 RepID=UPI001B7E2AC2|nr:homeobox protein knotted-1-like 1 [Juglans microcarpa x Juglans regia]
MEVMSNCREKGEKEEVLGGEDEILKKRISSHPSYGQLVEAHLGCLKVGAMVKFDRNHIRDQIKQQENNPSSLGMASSSTTRSELDHFMEAYCLALRKLKVAMEEPQQTSMAFINDMHSQLQELMMTSTGHPVVSAEPATSNTTTTASSSSGHE